MWTEISQCAGQVLHPPSNCLPILANVAQITGTILLIPSLVAAIIALGVAGRQIGLARRAFMAEQAARTEQLERHQSEQAEAVKRREREEAERRKRHRSTILTALQIEVGTISRGADQDLSDFELRNRNTPRAQAVSNEGEEAYKRAFVWTPLPMSTVEQAIHEAYLLDLSKESLEALQDLRLRLLRANSAITAKVAVLPALVGDRRLSFELTYIARWADVRANNLNSVLQNELRGVMGACSEIIQWLEVREGIGPVANRR